MYTSSGRITTGRSDIKRIVHLNESCAYLNESCAYLNLFRNPFSHMAS
jgi:hypothetical protein